MPTLRANCHPTDTALAERRAVRITGKAQDEMASLIPPADVDDVLEVLSCLSPAEWVSRLLSHRTGEPMYVFKPATRFGLLYLKVVIRSDCIVVSFHEEVET